MTPLTLRNVWEGANALSIRIITSGPGHSIVLDEIQGKIPGFINISQKNLDFISISELLLLLLLNPEAYVWTRHRFDSSISSHITKGIYCQEADLFLLMKGSILKIENPTGFHTCLTVRDPDAAPLLLTVGHNASGISLRCIDRKRQNMATIAATYCQSEPLRCCLHTFFA